MADTPNGETVTPGDSQTQVQTPAPVTGNASDPAEVERLRKETEQANLRIRQLENEKAAREKLEEEAKRKQLEENEEFRSLFEQEKAKRQGLESEAEEQVRKATIEKEQDDILKEFSAAAVELAKDTELSLTDESEEAKTAFRTKLEKIQSRVAANGRVTPNNQGASTAGSKTTEELLQEYATTGRKSSYVEAVGSLKWIQQAKAQNGEQ